MSNATTVNRNELIKAHYHRVRIIALKRLKKLPRFITLDEVISHGSLGLIDAAERYDPERGCAFATYATTRINGAILDGLREFEGERRDHRKEFYEEDVSDFIVPSPEGYDPCASSVQEDLRECVQKAVMALPKRERTAILLHEFKGLKLKEVAKIMGVTTTRIWQVRRDAFNHLRESLADIKDCF